MNGQTDPFWVGLLRCDICPFGLVSSVVDALGIYKCCKYEQRCRSTTLLFPETRDRHVALESGNVDET